MSPDPIRLITRQSPLALWQAEHVAALLRQHHPGLRVELIGITTAGDRFLASSLQAIGGKGLFVKELEEAMLRGEADIAVHSMKDVTVDLPPGLCLPTFLPRADARDCWLSAAGLRLTELQRGAIVGTSSLRRRCQLAALRPDLELIDLRGNVGTRLNKLAEGQYAAIVLAAAGLDRLGLSDHPHVIERLSPETMLPAVGQGIIGIECREDPALLALLAPLNDVDATDCVRAERALNRRLGGACHVPVAGYAVVDAAGALHLRGRVGSPDGRQVLAAEASGSRNTAEALGVAVAEALLRQGADQILTDLAR